MEYKEKTVVKRYVYQGKILSVRSDDAVLHDGTPCKREIIEHSGGAAVLFVQDGKIPFVRQYRYAYQESVLEIPAGKLEQGENPLKAALRELKEETGVCASEAKLLFVLYPSPGYTNEKIYIYRALNGVISNASPDEGEFLTVEWISLKKAKEMLLNGEFHDAKTIAALQAYFMEEPERN